MVTSTLFQCPACGSPLDSVIQPGQAEVKCPYCGNMVIVPPELRGGINPTPNFQQPTQQTYSPMIAGNFQGIDQTPWIKVNERNIIQRLLLLYPPHHSAGWIYRGLFFLGMLVTLFMFYAASVPPTGQTNTTSDSVLGVLLCFALPSLLLTLLFRWLAIRSDRKAEQARGM